MPNSEDLDPVLAVLYDLHFTHAAEGFARCLNGTCGEVVEVGPRAVSDQARLVYARRHREVCVLAV
jgi:hypothetical protein